MIFSIKSKNSNYLFIQSTALFLFIAKILSHKLWIADRVFPTAPPFEFLYAIPNFIHVVLYLISIICLLVCIVKPNIHKALLILILAEIISCLLDQNRWQPWEYQYVFMFFVLWYNRKKEDAALALVLLIIIFSSTYFYSGLQKFNPHFFKIVWKGTILEGFFHISEHFTQQIRIIRLGYIIPITEMLLGIGLLLQKTRKIAISILIAMHLIVLVIIGPWGINYNLIVWPWNLAMVAFLTILWNNKTNILLIQNSQKRDLNWITLIAWVCLPLLNFIGYWDYFFSSSLYAARIDMCNVEITNPPKNFELKKYYKLKEIGDSVETIVLQTWAMDEFNTPPSPQKRVYKKIKQQWLKKYPTINAKFIFIDRSHKKTIINELK